MLNYIIWNVNPSIIDGFHIRWYGLFFAIGFFISYLQIVKIFKNEGLTQNNADTLTFGTFLFLLVGLRLGHCLFYEPDVYLADPLRILFVWEGGLASHGGAIGLLCAFFWYSRKIGRSIWWLTSRVAVVIPITACLVRLGNLMNSEIYGVATTLPWGFVYVRDAVIQTNAQDFTDVLVNAGLVSSEAVQQVFAWLSRALPEGAVSFSSLTDALVVNKFIAADQINSVAAACVESGLLETHHPTQIYEAITYLITGGILSGYYFIHAKKNLHISENVILAVAFFMFFGTRFLVEFIKNKQVSFEDGLPIDMGQILSIPFILLGVFFAYRAIREKNTN